MKSTNIPEVKLGIIAVSRDCFPIALSEKRRAAIAAACAAKGTDLYECKITVENEQDMQKAVAEVTADALAPVQAEYGRILADKAYVDSVLKSGAERAARLANRTVSKVYRKVGLMQLDK